MEDFENPSISLAEKFPDKKWKIESKREMRGRMTESELQADWSDESSILELDEKNLLLCYDLLKEGEERRSGRSRTEHFGHSARSSCAGADPTDLCDIKDDPGPDSSEQTRNDHAQSVIVLVKTKAGRNGNGSGGEFETNETSPVEEMQSILRFTHQIPTYLVRLDALLENLKAIKLFEIPETEASRKDENMNNQAKDVAYRSLICQLIKRKVGRKKGRRVVILEMTSTDDFSASEFQEFCESEIGAKVLHLQEPESMSELARLANEIKSVFYAAKLQQEKLPVKLSCSKEGEKGTFVSESFLKISENFGSIKIGKINPFSRTEAELQDSVQTLKTSEFDSVQTLPEENEKDKEESSLSSHKQDDNNNNENESGSVRDTDKAAYRKRFRKKRKKSGPERTASDSSEEDSDGVVYTQKPNLLKFFLTPNESRVPSQVFQGQGRGQESDGNLYKGWVAVPVEKERRSRIFEKLKGSTSALIQKRPKFKFLRRIGKFLSAFFGCDNCKRKQERRRSVHPQSQPRHRLQTQTQESKSSHNFHYERRRSALIKGLIRHNKNKEHYRDLKGERELKEEKCRKVDSYIIDVNEYPGIMLKSKAFDEVKDGNKRTSK